MGYLFDNCTISVFTEELLSECEPFSCGVEDLDAHHKKTLKRYPGVLIGRLAVSNDVEFKLYFFANLFAELKRIAYLCTVKLKQIYDNCQ